MISLTNEIVINGYINKIFREIFTIFKMSADLISEEDRSYLSIEKYFFKLKKSAEGGAR